MLPIYRALLYIWLNFCNQTFQCPKWNIFNQRGYKNRSHNNVWYVPLSNLVDKEIGFRQKLYKPFQILWLGLCTQFFFQGSLIDNLKLSAMGLHKVLGHRSNSLSAGIGTCKLEQGQHSKSHSPCYCWKYYCNCSGKSTQHHPNLMKNINPCCKALATIHSCNANMHNKPFSTALFRSIQAQEILLRSYIASLLYLLKFPEVAEYLQAWLAVNHMLGVTICWVSGKHCPNWPSCRIRRCCCSN